MQRILRVALGLIAVSGAAPARAGDDDFTIWTYRAWLPRYDGLDCPGELAVDGKDDPKKDTVDAGPLVGSYGDLAEDAKDVTWAPDELAPDQQACIAPEKDGGDAAVDPLGCCEIWSWAWVDIQCNDSDYKCHRLGEPGDVTCKTAAGYEGFLDAFDPTAWAPVEKESVKCDPNAPVPGTPTTPA